MHQERVEGELIDIRWQPRVTRTHRCSPRDPRDRHTSPGNAVSTPTRVAWTARVLVLAGLVTGCGLTPATHQQTTPEPTVASPNVTATPSGATVLPVRTFPIAGAAGCDAIGVDNPVFGRLNGDVAQATEPVWLDDPDGRHISIVWPDGFKAVFKPQPSLVDGDGTAVANKGDTVLLQVGKAAATGTVDDPYYADGILLAGPQMDVDDYSGATYTGCLSRKR